MRRIRTVFVCVLLVARLAIGCGGASFDGGPSGTGVSAIRGDVVSVTGAGADLAGIRVSLEGTDLTTQTDANGHFELRGNASGPGELRFERQRDALFARTDVVIPAGGVLELEQIVLDSNSGEAHPTRQLVALQGVVEALDCGGGTIRVTPKDDDPSATVFTVEVASATIRDAGALTCGDLHVGDQVQISAETSDGSTLINALVVLEAGEDGPGDGPHNQSDSKLSRTK